jgi:hypothetical protein
MGEFYLVALLEALVRPGKPLADRPLGVQYLEALQAPLSVRGPALRHVGDSALALCGLFPESLERSLVGPDYYAGLGRLAYHHLAVLRPASRPDLGDVFAELAEGFSGFTAVLAEIALGSIFPRPPHVLGLYRHWLYTRAGRGKAPLDDPGFTPSAPETTRH